MQSAMQQQQGQSTSDAQVFAFPTGATIYDPLALIRSQAPERKSRVVLWTVCVLTIVMAIWATLGQLDIIASADGKLVPQTLLKVVQPAEAGVITQLLVKEGDVVQEGQLLARLDGTVAGAERKAAASDLATQRLQERRIQAELAQRDLLPVEGEDMGLFSQVQSHWLAHRKVFRDNIQQQNAVQDKAAHELKSAQQILAKLEQTLPTYQKVADAYKRLEGDGFMGGLVTAEKQREALEKAKDLDAQRSMVASLTATLASERNKLSQIESTYRGELEKELAETRARIQQLMPNLDKSAYREGLTELRAPQAGVVKDLATTTVGAVVQPGSVILTIVPMNEALYADVLIKNEDVGFVKPNQMAHIKVASYPFQQYGMLSGKVIYVSADASEADRKLAQTSNLLGTSDGNESTPAGSYKARVLIDEQSLRSPDGSVHPITPGMQVVAEINQGHRSVLAYLLAPLQRITQEAAHER